MNLILSSDDFLKVFFQKDRTIKLGEPFAINVFTSLIFLQCHTSVTLVFWLYLSAYTCSIVDHITQNYFTNSVFPIHREIMREIQRLRKEQEKQAKTASDAQRNPTLLAELRLLRQRKDELEARMSALQDSRRELMVQLEGLMKLLKVTRL